MYCNTCRIEFPENLRDKHFRSETHALAMTLKTILSAMDNLAYYIPNRMVAIQQLEGDIQEMFQWLASEDSIIEEV